MTLNLSPNTSAWQALRPQLEADIAERGVPRGEFVVSRMTKSVANCISAATEGPLTNAPALDIGTGTGYHSAMLLSLGHPRVCSVDIHPQAIEYAEDRLKRFLPNIPSSRHPEPAAFLEASEDREQAINLYPHSLGDIAKVKDAEYSIVSFNPPILYPFHDVAFDKPATQGVYFTSDNVKDPTQDLVYQFYDTIARNNVPVGGHVLCVWPNLLRHLVETDPFGENGDQPEFVHPCEVLKNWFGFEFDNAPESFDDFHCHTTVLAAGFFNQESVGELYERNLRHGIANRLYSDLLIPADGPTLAGTHFNFGVLHLVRTSATELRFRVVNRSSRD